jgi:hypothetical protein
MKTLIALLLLVGAYLPAQADIVEETLGCNDDPCIIRWNSGGNPWEFWLAVYAITQGARKMVVIDGFCASSCAWAADLLNQHDPTRVCVTNEVVFGFHKAQPGWIRSASPEIQPYLLPLLDPWHSAAIRAWVERHGGVPLDGGRYMHANDAKQFWSSCQLHVPLPRRRPPSAPRRTSFLSNFKPLGF